MRAVDFVIGFAVFAPFPILGVLCWIFWRAKKREDAEREALQRTGANAAQSIPK